MKWKYNDGGRLFAGFKGTSGVGDCVCRSIAIATKMPYKEVYDLINEFAKKERITKTKRTRSSARTGVFINTTRKVLEYLGWKWVPTMKIGSGCRVHLNPDELPRGRVIVRVSGHITTLIDGVINDNHDPSREGYRCVYGFWVKK